MHGTKVQRSEKGRSAKVVVAERQVRIVDEAELSSFNGDKWGRKGYIFGRMGLTTLPDEVGTKHWWVAHKSTRGKPRLRMPNTYCIVPDMQITVREGIKCLHRAWGALLWARLKGVITHKVGVEILYI